MAHWIRCSHDRRSLFGTLDGGQIAVHEGDMFDEPRATGERLPLDSVEVLVPTAASKMIGLWNNMRAVAAENNLAPPAQPLFFFKPPSCFLAHGGVIRQPRSHDGRIIFEAELGVVIGRRCKDVGDDEVEDCIFGYTCVNDVTAPVLLREDESFTQWCRSKSLDTFGAFGPVIATDIDPAPLRITGLVDGDLRQDYPVSDMFFSPQELVKRISRDMTLVPGDIVSCGTSLGTLTIEPGNTVEISIDGIGTLTNTFA